MFRKSMIALAAVAALGFTAFSATEASAKPWKGGGWGKGWGYHHFHGHRLAYGFAAMAVGPYCYEVVTRRGFIRTICD